MENNDIDFNNGYSNLAHSIFPEEKGIVQWFNNTKTRSYLFQVKIMKKGETNIIYGPDITFKYEDKEI